MSTRRRGTKTTWTCSNPDCGKLFEQYPSQVADLQNPHCSNACRSRHASLRKFPMSARLEAAERYRNGEHTGMLNRLARQGIHTRRARTAALIALAAELPAPVLADLLEIHIHTALKWARHAQRDWSTYLSVRVTDLTAATRPARP